MAPAPPALKMALTQRPACRCACVRKAERGWSFGGCLERAGGGERSCEGRAAEYGGIGGRGWEGRGSLGSRVRVEGISWVGSGRSGWTGEGIPLWGEEGGIPGWGTGIGLWVGLFSRLCPCAEGGSAQVRLRVWKYPCGFKFNVLMDSCGWKEWWSTESGGLHLQLISIPTVAICSPVTESVLPWGALEGILLRSWMVRDKSTALLSGGKLSDQVQRAPLAS